MIIAFLSDLYFISRIESAAERVGLQVFFIESEEDLIPADPPSDPDRPGEALTGREGTLIRLLAEKQPALLVFDLNAAAIPWQRWIALLKSSAATRRIPILAFGAHMDVPIMQAARSAGADQVLARSRFTADLPELLRRHARSGDPAAVAAACTSPLSELALEGIALFNQGEYYESHEVLEDAWNQDETAARELYRAILQVAVAYLQIERGNFRGAAKMFLRVRQWLSPLPEVCRGVDVERLRDAAFTVEAELLRLGPDRMAELDRALFVPVTFRGGEQRQAP